MFFSLPGLDVLPVYIFGFGNELKAERRSQSHERRKNNGGGETEDYSVIFRELEEKRGSAD